MEAEEKLRAEQTEKERLVKEAEHIRAENERGELEETEKFTRQEEEELQRQSELESKEREKQHQIELENAWKRKHPVQAFMAKGFYICDIVVMIGIAVMDSFFESD